MLKATKKEISTSGGKQRTCEYTTSAAPGKYRAYVLSNKNYKTQRREKGSAPVSTSAAAPDKYCMDG
jgi:hypothetical protein